VRDLQRLRSRWAFVDGVAIHTRVPRASQPPNRPAVVLVHGIGVSSRYMAPLAARLADRFRVFAIDLPGFGHSDKPRPYLDLDGLADALAGWIRDQGLGRPALVGNSFGCQIIVRMALRHPHSLSRAVLQGPTGDPDASVPRQIGRWILAGKEQPFSLNGVIAHDYYDCGLGRALGAFRSSVSDPLREELPRVHVPVLVARGGRDRIATQAWAEEFASRLPNARLVVLPAAAHAMNYGAPDAFARAITPFLNEEDRREPRRRAGMPPPRALSSALRPAVAHAGT
jgi:2-hydroxy-6-oxonona-2,4-dienedioate hydrolase